MKLHSVAGFITILLLIIRFDAVRFDASAADDVDFSPDAYTEYYLKFENWMKLTSDQRKTVIAKYMNFIITHDLKPTPTPEIQATRNRLWDIHRDEFLDTINEACNRFEHLLRLDGSMVDAIILQYVKNRVEAEKNFYDLLSVAKNLSKAKDMGNKDVPAPGKQDMFEYSERYGNLFDTPKYRFSYEWWQKQNQDAKKVLITGYVAFLHILIKEDWCSDEEERRRYDQFCKLVSVDDLVNHVDSMFKDPLNRNEGAQWLIYKYMTDNFQIFIGDPIALQG